MKLNFKTRRLLEALEKQTCIEDLSVGDQQRVKNLMDAGLLIRTSGCWTGEAYYQSKKAAEKEKKEHEKKERKEYERLKKKYG